MIDVTIIIKAVNQATNELREVNKELEAMHKVNKENAKQYERLAKMSTMAGVALLGVGVAGGALIAKSVELSSRVQTLATVLRGVGINAGYTEEELTAFHDRLRKMGIDILATKQAMIQMLQAEMPLTDATAQLARVAQNAAVILGTNSSDAMMRLVVAIQRGETEMLRTMGIVVDFGGAYKRLAEETGVATSDLSLAEKQAARLSEVFRAASPIMGAYEDAMGEASKQVGSMDRLMKDIQVTIGDQLLPAYTDFVAMVYEGLQAWSAQSEATKEGQAVLTIYGTAVALAGGAALIAAGQVLSLAASLQTMGIVSASALGPIGLIAAGLIAIGGVAVKARVELKALKQEFHGLARETYKTNEAYQDYIRYAVEAAEGTALWTFALRNSRMTGRDFEDVLMDLLYAQGLYTEAQWDAMEAATASDQKLMRLAESLALVTSATGDTTQGMGELEAAAYEAYKKLQEVPEEVETSVIVSFDAQSDIAGLADQYQRKILGGELLDDIEQRIRVAIAMDADQEVIWDLLGEGAAAELAIDVLMGDLTELDAATTLAGDFKVSQERAEELISMWIRKLATEGPPALQGMVEKSIKLGESFEFPKGVITDIVDLYNSLQDKTITLTFESVATGARGLGGPSEHAAGGPLTDFALVGEAGPEMIINGIVIPATLTRTLRRLGLLPDQQLQAGGPLFGRPTKPAGTDPRTRGGLRTGMGGGGGGGRGGLPPAGTVQPPPAAEVVVAAMEEVVQAIPSAIAQQQEALLVQQRAQLQRQLDQGGEQLETLGAILGAIQSQGTAADYALDVSVAIEGVLG